MAALNHVFPVILGLLGILGDGRVAGSILANCNIPPAASTNTEAGQGPLRFEISPIKSDPAIFFTPVQVESYIYTVDYCFMTLYATSKITAEKNPFLKNVKISGETLSCRSLDDNPSQAHGVILRYFNDSMIKPGDVPAAWYRDGRMVIRINFYTFPQTPTLRLRCGVKRDTGVGKVEIFGDITIRKIGCPRTHWGTRCEVNCPCQNGGVCHTFHGLCSCPGDYAGVNCQIDLKSTAKPITTANTTEDVNSAAAVSKLTGSTDPSRTATHFIFENDIVYTTKKKTDNQSSSSFHVHATVGFTVYFCAGVLLLCHLVY